jgi:hypothetical protein
MITDIFFKLTSYFKDLLFEEESHTYTYLGKKLPSVSKKVHHFVEEKDWLEIATNVAKKRNVDVEIVLKEWEDKKVYACDRGHDVHKYGENLVEKEDLTKSELAFLRRKWISENEIVEKFWSELNERYFLVCTELRMVHKKFNFAGTLDILLYDSFTGKFIIADYKTNIDLFKNFKGETLIEPFDFLQNCPYNLYQLQLSYYQLCLEQIEGIEVQERWVIYINQETKSYDLLKTNDYSNDLKLLLHA